MLINLTYDGVTYHGWDLSDAEMRTELEKKVGVEVIERAVAEAESSETPEQAIARLEGQLLDSYESQAALYEMFIGGITHD